MGIPIPGMQVRRCKSLSCRNVCAQKVRPRNQRALAMHVRLGSTDLQGPLPLPRRRAPTVPPASIIRSKVIHQVVPPLFCTSPADAGDRTSRRVASPAPAPAARVLICPPFYRPRQHVCTCTHTRVLMLVLIGDIVIIDARAEAGSDRSREGSTYRKTIMTIVIIIYVSS